MRYLLVNKSLKDYLISDNIYPETYKIGQVVSGTFATVARSMLRLTAGTTTSDILLAGQSNVLWCKYIVPRYKDMIVGQELVNWQQSQDEQAARNKELFMERYMSVLNRTYDYFTTMINILDEEKDNLMDAITSRRTSRFNDTPQDGGDFSDDEHTTNITQETSTNELVSKMSRIAEIDAKLSDYYASWCNEFGGIFIYE